jgi:hypothetical protein
VHEQSGSKGKDKVKVTQTLKYLNMKDNKKSNVEEEEFGYHDGKMFTLATFKKMANLFKAKWFPHDENPPPEVVENAYWRIVEKSEECVQVHYGR